jgi:hypothetical protein
MINNHDRTTEKLLSQLQERIERDRRLIIQGEGPWPS